VLQSQRNAHSGTSEASNSGWSASNMNTAIAVRVFVTPGFSLGRGALYARPGMWGWYTICTSEGGFGRLWR
jgi:hypothetical protein